MEYTIEGKNLCFVYYVAGDNYMSHIPLCMYFLSKSHPESVAVVYVKRTCPEKIKELCSVVDYDYTIIEDVFSDYIDEMNMAKTLRWLVPTSGYSQADYVYMTDIDLWTTCTLLLTDHLGVCNKYGTYCSNTDQIDNPPGEVMAGMHFFVVQPYLQAMQPVIDEYTDKLAGGYIEEFWHPQQGRYSPNLALFIMCNRIGLKTSQHSFMKYHGLHLGHSRCPGRWEELFKFDIDAHYYNYKMALPFFNTEVYEYLYKHAAENVRDEIDIMTSAWDKTF